MTPELDRLRARLREAGASDAELAAATDFDAMYRLSGDVGNRPAGDPMMIVERNLATRPLIDTLLDVLSQLYRYHSRLSFRDDSVAAGTFGEMREMAVGFVDLASSTELGSRLAAADLARSINEFNAAAFNAATHHGARVVKTIGDEVMLCALDPDAVCRAALALVEFCEEHTTFTAARGGVAAGDVLEQDGDCYGPVVNRAARFVESAPDGSVMVDGAVAAALSPGLAAIVRSPVEHRGLGTVAWFAVTS